MGTQDSGFVIEMNRLVAYHGDEKHVVIPRGVRVIKRGAFSGNDRIRTVNLNEVSSIGANAFESCSALEAVVIRKDLQNIGRRVRRLPLAQQHWVRSP
jgi:hypothetical protein